MNDILMYNNDSTKHWRYVRQILERLRKYSLYVNLKKCKFNITKIEFLDFIVFLKDVQMNLKRIETIKK